MVSRTIRTLFHCSSRDLCSERPRALAPSLKSIKFQIELARERIGSRKTLLPSTAPTVVKGQEWRGSSVFFRKGFVGKARSRSARRSPRNQKGKTGIYAPAPDARGSPPPLMSPALWVLSLPQSALSSSSSSGSRLWCYSTSPGHHHKIAALFRTSPAVRLPTSRTQRGQRKQTNGDAWRFLPKPTSRSQPTNLQLEFEEKYGV